MDSSADSHHRRRPGEFELISALKRLIERSTPPPGVVIGIGDDAAVVESKTGLEVMTTDTMVDGIHFLRGRADWADVGWKSAISNLSDIAAMGAVPLHALVTIGVPNDVSAVDMERMYGGMIAAFAEHGGGIVGGDVVSSPVFFVTVALTGAAREVDGAPLVLRRDAAQPGDLIGVTGSVGGSAGGLKAIIEGSIGADAEALKRMHYRSVPRIAEAETLVSGGVLCAMDVSDGLVGDLEKLCAASELGAVINASSVPMPAELKNLYPDQALQMALGGGEDYELLFTAPFDLMDRLFARHRGMITHIGQIVEEHDQGSRVVVRDATGADISLEHRGWDHLESE